MAANHRIAIVGAGTVGTAIAYASLIQGVTDEIALYDQNGSKAEAEMLDLRHGLQFVRRARVESSDSIDVCAGADIVVVTAGAKQHPGQSRLDLAHANATLVRELVPQLLDVAPDAVLLLVTNPVDVVTFVAQEVVGGSTRRVLGSGTVLDTSRLRHLIAERIGVAVNSVHATIAGEHGDTSIALWSTATVGGVPISEVVGPAGEHPSTAALDALVDDVRAAAYRIIAGKGATNLAIGLATARILTAIGTDEHAVLPVSSRHEIDGVGEVCLSLPAVVGRGGVVGMFDVPLDETERAGLRASAQAIRSVIDQVTPT